MSDDFFADTDKHLNECLAAFYSALRAAKEAHEASERASQAAVEAAELAETYAKANLKLARKGLLFKG